MIDSQPAQDDRTIAILTHLSGIFFGFLVPLIVWLVAKDTKPWLSGEAKEALNFQITVLLVCIAAGILSVVGIGLLLFPIVWVLNIVFCVVGAVKTSQNTPYQYPLTLRLIK